MTDFSVHMLDASSREAWNVYIQKKSARNCYDLCWVDVINKVFGHQAWYLMCRSSAGEICGVLPLIRVKSLLFGDYLVSMPYLNYGGVLADSVDAEQALLEYADDLKTRLGCSHIELRGPLQNPDSLPVRTDKVTMVLNLPENSEELWQSIGAKRRAQIKRPIREGVEFFTGGEDLLDEFYTVFSINMRDLGTPVYSKKFFREILNGFKEQATIALVRLKGKPVGAGFLLSTGSYMEIPWASTLREFNRIGVNMFLYWNILKHTIDNGFTVFDFGRSSKDSGTLKFKKQWGSSQQQLHWYYLLAESSDMPGLNPSNPKFQAAIALWKKLPVPVANLIGPSVVKGLP